MLRGYTKYEWSAAYRLVTTTSMKLPSSSSSSSNKSDVHSSVHRNTRIFQQYNQQDATVSQIIYSCKMLCMFRYGLSVHHQELMDDGRKNRPKHVRRFTRINNLRNRCSLLVVLLESSNKSTANPPVPTFLCTVGISLCDSVCRLFWVLCPSNRTDYVRIFNV